MPTTTQFAFANNVSTTLASACTSTATTLTLASSANFPTIPAGFVWAVTLNDHATQTIFEIVYVTATSGANLTCLRGQEGTSARAWSVGDYVFAPDTAGILNSFVDQAYLNSLGVLTYAGLFNPRAYGALGNGTTNDAAAFTAANTASAGSTIYVPPGNYLISTSIAITSPIIFAAGAILNISGTGSITATFSYTPQAGRYAIFAGAALNYGVILFAATSHGLDPIYPEWWSAIPNGFSSDCGPGFQRAASSLANTFGGEISMGAGNYQFQSSAVFQLSNFTLSGQGIGSTTLTFSNMNTSVAGFLFGGASSGSPTSRLTIRDFYAIWNAQSGHNATIIELQYGTDAKVIDVMASCTSGATITAVNASFWTGGLIDDLATRGAIAYPFFFNQSPDWTAVNGDFRCDTSASGYVFYGNLSPNFVAANNRMYATGSAQWVLFSSVTNGSDGFHFTNNALSPGSWSNGLTGNPAYFLDATQTNGYIDYQSGTWTPTDLSGAGLTFTVNSSSWEKWGHSVHMQMDITWPTNSNASPSVVSLPFPQAANLYTSFAIGYNNSSLNLGAAAYNGALVFFAMPSSTGSAANSTLSTHRLMISGDYQSAY